jgi:hemin uptake protein HemP
MMQAEPIDESPSEQDGPVSESIAAGDPIRAGSGTDRPIIYSSAELFGGDREVWIDHRGELYRLRITGSGKLYLTK